MTEAMLVGKGGSNSRRRTTAASVDNRSKLLLMALQAHGAYCRALVLVQGRGLQQRSRGRLSLRGARLKTDGAVVDSNRVGSEHPDNDSDPRPGAIAEPLAGSGPPQSTLPESAVNYLAVVGEFLSWVPLRLHAAGQFKR